MTEHVLVFSNILSTQESEFVNVKYEMEPYPSIKISTDRDKIASIGRPPLGELILKLHVFRCSKDIDRGPKGLRN